MNVKFEGYRFSYIKAVIIEHCKIESRDPVDALFQKKIKGLYPDCLCKHACHTDRQTYI